jgi:hypothetical protein
LPNVTDSLNFVLDHLPEIEHQLDDACYLVVKASSTNPASLKAAHLALGSVRGQLHYVIDHLVREHQALVDAGALFRVQVCENCGNPFSVTTHGRGPRRWCSQACRQAAYRNRSRATEMHAQVTDG